MLDGVDLQPVMFDLHDRLPFERRRVAEDIDARPIRGTLKDHVKPEVVREALRRSVFVGSERNFANLGAALDFDEAHVNRGLRIFRM